MDGFLIGLCAATNATTAYIMAAATSIEMGFLGLAFGCTLWDDYRNKLESSASRPVMATQKKKKTATQEQKNNAANSAAAKKEGPA